MIYIGDFLKKCMVDAGDFQQFAGSAERALDARQTLVLHSARASQVISLGARAQSCICWTSETRAAARASRGAHFGNLLENLVAAVILKFAPCTKSGLAQGPFTSLPERHERSTVGCRCYCC